MPASIPANRNRNTGTVALEGQLRSTLTAAGAFDLYQWERRPRSEIAKDLLPGVLRLLDEAGELMRSLVIDEAEEESQGSGCRELPRFPEEELSDLAFLATFELTSRRERLAGASDRTPRIELLATCEGALRSIRKSCSAILDIVAGSTDDREPAQVSEPSVELASSLRVRATYAKLRSQVLRDEAPSAATLRDRLRCAGNQLAVLVGLDVYREIRLRDRTQLHEIKMRILGWLRDPAEDTVEGFRLWQDLESFLQMLRSVNRRQELVRHDTRRIESLHEQLRHEKPSTEAVDELVGLDEELDGLLAKGSVPDDPEMRRVLERLHQQFVARAE